jgi:speckle-type POZ protein
MRAEIGSKNSLSTHLRLRRGWVDRDEFGPNMPTEPAGRVSSAHTGHTDVAGSTCKAEVVNFREALRKGELLWKIEGMSWLVNGLKQRQDDCVQSTDLVIGNHAFCARYNPNGEEVGKRGDKSQRGSLVIVHSESDCEFDGVTFRYRFLVGRSRGEFVQWSGLGDECHPDTDTRGWAFGPDVQLMGRGRDEPTRPIGIFGLTHTELLASEWIKDDTLTVKIELELREDEHYVCSDVNAEITIPARTIDADLLALLEDGTSSDVTFIVEGERIKAHSQILAARSAVFERHLNGGMSESLSREIVIEDCDAFTFRALLRFLYTDDFDCMEKLPYANTAAPNNVSSGCAGLQNGSRFNMASLQIMLAVSHKYQLARLRSWCEHRLCECISVPEVCSVLCQAHLYEAEELEKACLAFIAKSLQAVVLTEKFGTLGKEWPEVMLKVNTFTAGVSESSAALAIQAQREALKGMTNKRKRDE